MFVKYNGVLRAKIEKLGKRIFERAFLELNLLNRYVTTLHAINSALLKLSVLTQKTKLYRGLKNVTLPEEFYEQSELGNLGGVDHAFMSASTQEEVARGYAGGGSVTGIVLEIHQGMVDRGADLSWLSQYPHEKEVCFGALSCIEPLTEVWPEKELMAHFDWL